MQKLAPPSSCVSAASRPRVRGAARNTDGSASRVIPDTRRATTAAAGTSAGAGSRSCEEQGGAEGKPVEKRPATCGVRTWTPRIRGRWCLNDGKEPKWRRSSRSTPSPTRTCGTSERFRSASASRCYAWRTSSPSATTRSCSTSCCATGWSIPRSRSSRSRVPGAGWANVRCDCSRDWKAELDARKAARRKRPCC